MPLRIELEAEEVNRVLSILANAPWAQVNPLIMKIAEQARLQSGFPEAGQAAQGTWNDARKGNSGGDA